MKTVLILGALSDIAQALAREFATRGYRPLLAARRAPRLTPLVQDLKVRHQVDAAGFEFDLLAPETHAAFYAGLPARPDVVICVAGYLGDTDKVRHDAEEARRVLLTNFNGAVSILDVVADDLEQRKAGCIVGISSVAGDRGRQSNYHYGSAKAGFTAYLSGLRNRLAAAGVHVLTVKPGFVRTRMTEGMKLPPALTADPTRVARDIARAVEKRTNVLYTLWMWRWVMLVIQHIPEFLFKKLKL